MVDITCSLVLKILLVISSVSLLCHICLLFSMYSPTVEHAGHGMSGLLPWSQLSSMGCVCKVCFD